MDEDTITMDKMIPSGHLHQGTLIEGKVACLGSLQGTVKSSFFYFLFAIENQEELCLKANSNPKEQAWN